MCNKTLYYPTLPNTPRTRNIKAIHNAPSYLPTLPTTTYHTTIDLPVLQACRPAPLEAVYPNITTAFTTIQAHTKANRYAFI
jgi:hypothetical protein